MSRPDQPRQSSQTNTIHQALARTGASRMPLNARITGLRGITSLIIVLGHLCNFHIPGAPNIEYFSAVGLFIILSGWGLASSQNLEKNYWRRRVQRILPVYYASVFIDLPAFIIWNFGAPSIPLTFIMGQSIIPWIPCDLNGPLWTVSALMIYYAIFYWFRHRFIPHDREIESSSILNGTNSTRPDDRQKIISPNQILAISAVCLAAIPLISMLATGHMQLFLHFAFWTHAPQFFCGIAIAHKYTGSAPLSKLIFVLSTIAILIYSSLCPILATESQVFEDYQIAGEFLITLPQAFFIAGLVSIETLPFLFDLVFTNEISVFLGEISYEIYAMHFPIIDYMSHIDLTWYAFVTAVLAATIVAAKLLSSATRHGFFEELRLKKTCSL